MNISLNYQNNGYYNNAPNNISAYGSMNRANSSINAPQCENSKVDAKSTTGKVECQTCKSRKYVDGSNDPGVSFKTPGHIAPQNSAAKVKSHEMEHVSNAIADATGKNREIISQSVKLDTSICPECGRSYVSGGTTTTVSKSSSDKSDYFKNNYEKKMSGFFGKEIDLKV
ncbi:hypothetical protein [Acetivibrio cellulolyticus]|uniref:hypothetical protein n=1 Tax=Acetivibrio cellulolyticus TaxID=35830 RepID=UPI0001E3012E|nr:hypothetical protein [Acetivibrio cellulolyticus]